MKTVYKSKPGVYMIYNVLTGERYVGGTIQPITNRFSQLKYSLNERQYHADHPLQRAWNKHGKETFRLVVLENTDPDRAVVVEREQHWLDHFRGQGVGLYNRCPSTTDNTGLTMPEDTKQKRAQDASTFWQENPDVKEQMVEKVRDWWTEERKQRASEREKARFDEAERQKQSERLREAWAEDREQMLGDRVYHGPYDFVSPDGEHYHVEHLTAFCKEHGLDPSRMSKIWKGAYGAKSHKGWSRYAPA